MTLLEALALALIQAVGESLPLGASGMLTAFPWLSGPVEARAATAMAAHFGILMALLAYFWRDASALVLGVWRLGKGKPDRGSRLFLHLLAGSIPAALAGWFLIDAAAGVIGPKGAAILIILGGCLLWLFDKLGVTVRRIEHLTVTTSVILGSLQVLALLPGVSRTGVTITMARLLGWERQAAARLSLLLALPLIAGQTGHGLWLVSQKARLILSMDLVIAAGAAALATLFSVALMMAWVERRSFVPFAAARILLGAAALAALILLG